MRLRVLGTGSKGNCYILTSGDRSIILDLGIRREEIVKGLDYNLMAVDVALVSHIHRDHSMSADKFPGMTVFKPFLDGSDILSRDFGKWNVKTFKLPHDGTENRGFLITADGQKILYMTDFEYCRYNFKSLKVDHMIVECNYQKEYLASGAFNFEHKVRGHCSLDYTCKFLADNQTDNLKNVVMIHRGLTSTDPDEMYDRAQQVVGPTVNIYVAEKGMEICL